MRNKLFITSLLLILALCTVELVNAKSKDQSKGRTTAPTSTSGASSSSSVKQPSAIETSGVISWLFQQANPLEPQVIDTLKKELSSFTQEQKIVIRKYIEQQIALEKSQRLAKQLTSTLMITTAQRAKQVTAGGAIKEEVKQKGEEPTGSKAAELVTQLATKTEQPLTAPVSGQPAQKISPVSANGIEQPAALINPPTISEQQPASQQEFIEKSVPWGKQWWFGTTYKVPNPQYVAPISTAAIGEEGKSEGKEAAELSNAAELVTQLATKTEQPAALINPPTISEQQPVSQQEFIEKPVPWGKQWWFGTTYKVPNPQYVAPTN